MKLQHRFLRNCIDEQVVPRSLTNRRLNSLSTVPFEEYHRLIIEKHIELAKIEENAAFRDLRGHKRTLLNCIPDVYIKIVFDYCYNKLRIVCKKIERKHINILNRLIQQSKWTTDANNDFVCNISDKPLDNTTVTALGYGINFSIKENMNWLEIGHAFCKLEKNSNIPIEQINICKGIIYGISSNAVTPNVPKRFLKAYQKLKKDKDIHVTKADKSNTLVIMNRTDYDNKMSILLEDEVTYTKLRSNPLERDNAAFNKNIKNILVNFKELVPKFITTCPSLPYLFGVIKTHKENYPARPIISSVGSCTYKLSIWLVNELSPSLDPYLDVR